jgi:hypothetical protein
LTRQFSIRRTRRSDSNLYAFLIRYVIRSNERLFADTPDTSNLVHPCRPTVSCTAEIVAPGNLEIEAGALDSKVPGGTAHVVSFPLLVELSLTRIVELQVGSNGYTLVDAGSSARYFDNVYAGPKLHFHDQGDLWPSLALSAQIALPTFEAAGYARHDDVFLTAFASKDVGSFHFDWNVGALFWGIEGQPAAQAFTALALSPTLPAPFGAALEGYCFSDASPLAPRDGGLRIAWTVTARSWLVFDAGADLGFFPSTRAFSFFLARR